MMGDSVYQFTVNNVYGEAVSLTDFKGKVLLIVNTASQCGFTRQLKDLEQLRRDYANEDFEILAFPSNDFGHQEPLEGSSLMKFCKINFGIRFPVFEKIHVKGRGVHPLFRFLADKKLNKQVRSVPRWNFHKYLVDREGHVVDYFYPFTRPVSGRIKKRINTLLSKLQTA
ncbi:MAG TPA: glutathione peroxidase [Sphingobacteriaceae bacterium]